jgi:hypothetical protein
MGGASGRPPGLFPAACNPKDGSNGLMVMLMPKHTSRTSTMRPSSQKTFRTRRQRMRLASKKTDASALPAMTLVDRVDPGTLMSCRQAGQVTTWPVYSCGTDIF